MSIGDRVLASLGQLFSSPLTHDRFRRWKTEEQAFSNVFDDCVLGEIFWRKGMGRPMAAKLSDGFSIRSWRTTKMLVPTPAGLTSTWIKSPHVPRWWDGKDDASYWRVPYLISDIPFGHRKDLVFGDFDETTFVIPELEDLQWDVPGGAQGIGFSGARVFEPRDAVFVKEHGSVHMSFEVVPRILQVIQP
ncbi:hypothetical protein AB4Z46_28130 [Variovorax sp. M-6]|uniref:hypothetical protein n=1 Tax=Variovorax sp. M-6 TaxID=3233041 RepID=UPI003F9C7740